MELLEKISLDKIDRIELFVNSKKQYMSTIQSQTGADYIINGTIYNPTKFTPYCNIKKDGKVLNKPNYQEWGFVWNDNDIQCGLLPNDKDNYIGCVCMTRNGKKETMYYGKDMGGARQRSVIAMDNDNLILYACNGTHSKTPEKLQTYAIQKGWKHSVMLDGGGSTQMMSPTQSLFSSENNGKGRIVQHYILVYLKKEETKVKDDVKNEPQVQKPIVTSSMKNRDGILNIARWQIGVMESPAGSNKVKYNTDYYGREVSGSAYPWCMAFVWWVFKEAGFNLKKTASCSQLTTAYQQGNAWVTANFKPGDIVMFDFSGKKKKTEHCGIVLEVYDDYLVTVEGNTSKGNDSNGGAVMRRERDLKYITGACRPKYNM